MCYYLPGEIWLILTLQSTGAWLTPIMKFFTWLGYPQAYMIIMALIYWSLDRKLGLRLAMFLPLTASLNSIMKQAFHAPRPYWVDPDIKAILVSNGFGMPSGHAQASTVWLYAAALLKSRWFWFMAIVVALMVGLSRVYLGVHFSSQVLSGWLAGILVLILFLRLEKNVLKWFLSRKLYLQLIWIAAVTLIILILGGVFVYQLSNWEMPLEWIRNSADKLAGKNETILASVGLSSVAGNAGGFLGVALGAILWHRKGGFDPGGPAWKRVLRSVAGLLALTALYALINWIEPEETRDMLHSFWSFCGFFLLSFSAIFLMPILFRRLKLIPL